MLRSVPMALVPALLAVALDARADPAPVSFRGEVAPILVRRCLGCHNGKKSEAGLNMTTPALLKKGGENGGELILEPGEPDGSLLIEVVRPGGAPRMPYKQRALRPEEIATLERWVKEGARFDVPSESETRLASLVDPLKDLPRVAMKTPVAEAATALVFTPDGTHLAAAIGRNVVLFDVASGKELATLADHPGPLTALGITPDGATLVAAGGRPGMFGSVTAWDLGSRSRRFDVRGHTDAILGAAIAPDGKTLATASYDRQVRLWNLADGKPLRTLKDHTDAVYSVAFSPDGRLLASAGADRTVKLWDLASGRRVSTFSDATAELYAVTFGPKGETVHAGGVDRSIHSWRVNDRENPPVHSVFAHGGSVLRLAVSADRETLVSSGEDREVKVWELPGLTLRRALVEQSDWPQGLALSPDGTRIAVGRFDGSLAWYATGTGKLVAAPRKPPKAATPPPRLVRGATLNPPSPRGGVRGSTVRVTLSGNGVGRATSVVFDRPGITGTLVASSKVEPNRLEVDLAIAPDARPGIYRLSVLTPLGVPTAQPFSISSFPETTAREPDDELGQLKPVDLPATLSGTIERPGDLDRFRFEARAGTELVFKAQTGELGPKLVAILGVLDDQGQTVAEASALEQLEAPVLGFSVPRDGRYTLTVADADYGGSAGHFYRIDASASPYLTSAFPLGVERGTSRTIRLEGLNLKEAGPSSVRAAPDARAGSLVEVPLAVPGPAEPVNRRMVVVGDGPQGVERTEPENDKVGEAIAVPGGVSGWIGREGDVDLYRFKATRGRRLIVEVYGRRLGTPIDPVIEILDPKGEPVPRVVLRPVDQTEVAFRDHDASKPGIRLTRWNNLAIDDLVLIGREVARIRALPRNPDDDCIFWNEQNKRLGFLETTTEHHPTSQPIYKVTIHPPGTSFPSGGVPPVTLTYRNDDGGPSFSKDSRITFDPPADGMYQVRVEDVRGLGGKSFGYHLLVREPRPDFTLSLGSENPAVARGGTTLVTATVTRIDGFQGAVEVMVDGLPPGVTATPARIEGGDFTASLALTAEPWAPTFSPPTWHVTARALGADSQNPGASDLRHEVDPGGPGGGRITVLPPPNLTVEATPTQVVIVPGQRVSMKLAVRRGPAFAGRVPIEVRNLPLGVRVLNIGLNGVLIPEQQSERTVFLYAEPWVQPMKRPFYAVGKAESASSEHSSPPIELVVTPERSTEAASATRE